MSCFREDSLEIPVISFVGHHNAGKTVLIEKVIARLVSQGVRVGSVKHHGLKDPTFDVPSNDTSHHAAAGASHVIMVAPTCMTDYRTIDHEPSIDEVLARLTDVDMVVVEGYKHAKLPSIAVARSAVDSVGTLNVLITPQTVAVACDEPLAAFAPRDLPRVDLNDADSVVALVRTVCGV